MQSLVAIVGGIGANFAAVPIDAAFHATGVFPPAGEIMSNSLFGLAFVYRFILAVAGGYVTAKFAPREPTKHALVLGGIGTVLSAGGAAAMWEYGPAWYPLSLVVIALPCSWYGSKLYVNKSAKSA